MYISRENLHLNSIEEFPRNDVWNIKFILKKHPSVQYFSPRTDSTSPRRSSTDRVSLLTWDATINTGFTCAWSFIYKVRYAWRIVAVTNGAASSRFPRETREGMDQIHIYTFRRALNLASSSRVTVVLQCTETSLKEVDSCQRRYESSRKTRSVRKVYFHRATTQKYKKFARLYLASEWIFINRTLYLY